MTLVAYQGWPNCVRLANEQLELIATTDVGPRIVHLAAHGGENMLGLVKGQVGLMGGDEWRVYGGHRFWHAPQVAARTELPDNKPVEWALEGSALRLIQPEPATGIRKEMLIRLVPGEARIVLRHIMHNTGLWAVELAPWAITGLNVGGLAMVPENRGDPVNGRLPNRLLALWPWGSARDARFQWGERYSTLRQDPANAAPFKVGMNATAGWAAYYRRGQLLVKCVQHQAGAAYPDLGCSVEMYVCGDFLELETLGPMLRLEPGAMVEHVEQWVLFSGVPAVADEDDIEARVLPLAREAQRRCAADWD